jgi:hypothetical protein
MGIVLFMDDFRKKQTQQPTSPYLSDRELCELVRDVIENTDEVTLDRIKALTRELDELDTIHR